MGWETQEIVVCSDCNRAHDHAARDKRRLTGESSVFQASTGFRVKGFRVWGLGFRTGGRGRGRAGPASGGSGSSSRRRGLGDASASASGSSSSRSSSNSRDPQKCILVTTARGSLDAYPGFEVFCLDEGERSPWKRSANSGPCSRAPASSLPLLTESILNLAPL